MGLSISRAPKQGQDAVPEDISISCLRHVPQTESCPNLRESAGRCRPGQSRTCSNTLSTSNYAFDCNCRDMFICIKIAIYIYIAPNLNLNSLPTWDREPLLPAGFPWSLDWTSHVAKRVTWSRPLPQFDQLILPVPSWLLTTWPPHPAFQPVASHLEGKNWRVTEDQMNSGSSPGNGFEKCFVGPSFCCWREYLPRPS